VNEFWRAGPTPSRRAAPGVRLRPSTSSRNGHRALPGRKTTTQKNLTHCFFSLCPYPPLLLMAKMFDTHNSLDLIVWKKQTKKTNNQNNQQQENEMRGVIKLKSVLLFVLFVCFFSLLFPHSFTTLHNRLELSCREPVPFFISCCFCFFLGGSYQRDWK
jgi:hypothetical protein